VIDGAAVEYFENGQIKGQDIYQGGILIDKKVFENTDSLVANGVKKTELDPKAKKAQDDKAKTDNKAKPAAADKTATTK